MSNRPFFPIQPSRSKPGGGFLRLAAAVLLLALAGAACSLNTGSNPSSSPTSTQAGSLKDLGVHLEGLSSYRAALHLEFNGTKDGAPLAWSQDLLLESDRIDSARLLTIDRVGPDSGQDAAGILIGQFGSMSLTRPAADGACRAETGDKPLAIPEPAGLLRPVQQPLAYSGSPEEKNGVLALHATLDARAVGASPQAQVKGEIWVAKDGGYVISYALEINGAADDWGKGVEGVMRWEYNLETVGQPLGLLPPPGCPLGMVDAPMPEDATQVETRPGSLSLTTGLDVAAAAQFYRERLPLQGWSKDGADFLSPHAARLVFQKPGRQLVLNIRAGPPAQVWITLERPAASVPQTPVATATPGGPAENPANDPVTRVVSSLNILLDPSGGTPAFPSYHLEVNHLAPVWEGGKLAQKQEMLSANVQGKDVHFIDRETAPSGSATTAEAYLIGDQEYDVKNGQVQPAGVSLTSLAWTLWPLDPTIIISSGATGAKAAGTEELEGRTAEIYELSGTGSALAGVSGLGPQVTSVSGKVWVDQQTGALVKAVLDYQADVKDSAGALQGNGSGHLEIVVTKIGNAAVVLPGQ